MDLPFSDASVGAAPAQFLCKRAEIVQAGSHGAQISPRRACVLPARLDCV
jgi:hypothetical protein